MVAVDLYREGPAFVQRRDLRLAHLRAQDEVRFEIGAMGTSLEGEVADILALVGEIQEIPLMLGLPRSYTVLKLDNRVDREQGLEEKVASVERRLEESEGELPDTATRPE